MNDSRSHLTTQDSFNWDELLIYLRDRRIVAIVGPALLRFQFNQKEVVLDEHLATGLASRLHVPLEAERPSVAAVASAFIKSGGRRQKVYAHLKAVYDETDLPLPEGLRKLAAISDLQLVVSITPDDLLLRALREARGEPIHSLAFSPGRPLEDLPAPGGGGENPSSTLFRLFGELCSVPDYAVTEEDTLEFLHTLQSDNRRPARLFDALRENYLLLLGCNLHDWFARFFIRTVRNERLLTSVERGELVVDDSLARDSSLALFLTQYATDIYPAGNSLQFIDELHRRWQSMQPRATAGAQAANAGAIAQHEGVPEGAVFLSYAHEDRAAARRLKAALEQEGLDAWLDEQDIPPAADWDLRIKQGIFRCAVFVPCLSRQAEARVEGYFRREWRQAVDRAESMAHTVRFVWPVVLDDLPEDAPNVPPEFRRWQWSRFRHGEPDAQLLAELKKEVRRVRALRQQGGRE